jgi:hypothetical protein
VLQDFADERIPHCQPSRYLLRCSNEQIERQARFDSASDSDCLSVGCPLEGHDHEQINIRVPLRSAIRVRPEEDDLLRTELACNLVAEAFDLAGGRFLEGVVSWSLHVTQLLVLRFRQTTSSSVGARHCLLSFRINRYAFAIDSFSQPGVAGLIHSNEIQFVDDGRLLERLKEVGPFLGPLR